MAFFAVCKAWCSIVRASLFHQKVASSIPVPSVVIHFLSNNSLISFKVNKYVKMEFRRHN